MSIQALSKSDVRALGSPLVLHDARSVIKELIENALDAHADTASVEISFNTLDVIQVRDNGCGIGAEDRHLLCKRGCTSKIRTIQDLENLGGSFLGFRGEALGSIAELSNSVVVTTRIDGDPVAATVKFGANGRPVSSSSASHPIGTTVRVQGFLKTLPVRRQTALKEAARTLSETKKILQAYSFARPNVRISFKVLKAKNEKYNWTYGPNPGLTTLLSATAKIVGAEAAAQCEGRLWESKVKRGFDEAHVIDAVVVKEGGGTVQKKFAKQPLIGYPDPTKACSKGQFVSVDGRPVSITRGVFKDFVKLYKFYYKTRISGAQSAGHPIDPFLALHLRCPTGSYDVNIEPAKDELLFTDTKNVLSLLEDFLKSVYGSLPEKPQRQNSPDNASALNDTQNQSFGLLLARKEQQPKKTLDGASERDSSGHVAGQTKGKDIEESLQEKETSAANESSELDQAENVSSALQRSAIGDASPHRNMFDFDEDDMSSIEVPLSLEGSPISGVDDTELRKPSVTNPWTIAKLNAPVSSTRSSPLKVGSGSSTEQMMTPGPDPGMTDTLSTSHRKPLGRIPSLPSPVRSDCSFSPRPYQNPGPPLRRRAQLHIEDEIEFTQETAGENSEREDLISSERRAKSRAPKVHGPSSHCTSETIVENSRLRDQNDRSDNYNERAPIETLSTPLTERLEKTCHRLQSRSTVTKPFKTPIKTPERALAVHPPLKLKPTCFPESDNRSPPWQLYGWEQGNHRSTSLSSLAHPPPLSQLHEHPMASPPRLQPSTQFLSEPLEEGNQTPNLDLEEIMDFEHRKKAVNAQRKSQTKLTNRYLNPGQLAQIKKDSAASSKIQNRVLLSSSPFQTFPAPSVNVRDYTEKSYNPARPPGTQFPDLHQPLGQETADMTSFKQSPHQNRYQAAKAALSPSNLPDCLSHAHSPAGQESTFETTDSIETLPPLPRTDPRAYLIQHRSISLNPATSHNPNTIPALTSPGLKIKRAKTSNLPFETISAECATYNLSTKPLTSSFSSPEDLAARVNQLDGVDDYVRTGKNQFAAWDTGSTDVLLWEEELARLVREKYVEKNDGNQGSSAGDPIPAKLQPKLKEIFKVHCEQLESSFLQIFCFACISRSCRPDQLSEEELNQRTTREREKDDR